MDSNNWIKDIKGGLSVLVLWQFLQLAQTLNEVTLNGGSDIHCWLPSNSGTFSTKSAYLRYFTGGVTFEPHRRIWKTWAPLKVKIFIWLAVWRRCWTTDKLARRGLQRPDRCPLYDQEEEDIDHLLVTCVFARETWFRAFQRAGLQHVAPDVSKANLATWWRRAHRRVNRESKKGFNSLVMLVAWALWKHRNRCVFDKRPPRMQDIQREIIEEATLWGMAGAKRLKELLGVDSFFSGN